MRHAKKEPEQQSGTWAEVIPHRKRVVYRHGDCPVKHRTQVSAEKCDPSDDEGGIYILHFSKALVGPPKLIEPYGGPFHYVGLASSFLIRIDQHKSGRNGAVKTKAALEQGITFEETLLTSLQPTTKNESMVTREVHSYCQVCSEEITAPLSIP